MSASLVGSEMCIRDSLWPASGLKALALAGAGLWFRTLSLLAVPGPASVPVSYTHLTLPTICSV
eukprot:14567411-Alexandrium_andersonii.AAC.1